LSVRRSQYRSRLQIVADILSEARVGAKKTRIMYRSNLSHELLDKYLTEVLNAGLLSFDGKDLYMVTRKGQEFLDSLNEHFEHFKQFEKVFNDFSQEEMALMKIVEANLNSRSKRASSNQQILTDGGETC